MSVARIIRWGLPAACVVAGVTLVVAGVTAVGEAVIVVAPCLVLAGWLIRLASEDVADRDREEAARVFMDEHGHWPDEQPGSSGAVDGGHTG